MKQAIISLTGTSPMCQSQDISHHAKLSGESPAAFDERMWKARAYTLQVKGVQIVHVKAHAIQACIIDGCKHTGLKIPGRGQKTWGSKFEAGLMVDQDMNLGIPLDNVECAAVNCGAKGGVNDGQRVLRRFPRIPKGWTASVPVWILDDDIPQDIFKLAVERAGLFIGIGQNRPAKRGIHGRLELTKLKWVENAAL